MALVPIYAAKLNTAFYTDVIGWNTPVTYTRPTPTSGGGRIGHEAPPYTETKNMRPLMRPFASPHPAFYVNNGSINSAYAASYYFESPAVFGLAGEWNLSRMMQAQMPGWKSHYDYSLQLIEAIEDRKIEDTWITTKPLLTVEEYDSEISVGATTFTEYVLPDTLIIAAEFEITPGGDPVPSIQATPCEMSVTWKSRRLSYRTQLEVSQVLAFYSDPPELELVTAVPVAGYTRIRPSDFGGFFTEINKAWTAPVPAQTIPFRGTNVYLYHVQPYLYELSDVIQDLESLDPAQPLTIFRVENVPDVAAGLIRPSTSVDGPLGNDNGVWPGKRLVYNAYGETTIGGDLAESSVILFDTKPKAWKFDDPEFVGYYPFTYYLWAFRSLIEDYCLNPDDRFDGLYFHHKVKIATATRAWQGIVRNVRTSTTSTLIDSMGCKLEQTQWYDTETGQLTLSGNACAAMTPISSTNWLGPDVIGPVEIPGFNWGNYEWPATSVTIPAGTFLLEDGSSAPIYPTFYGAYVYDLHLKKWGKYDGEYKRLLDYAAINTYLPSQQSFSRFGIFGGILTADGKIRIFDESPAISQVTYGKIGYYRQGMTSLEEVRVHHREFKTGVIKIESSIEGKLIDGSFTQEANFVDSPMWTKTGGYAAKWHNITIMGQFDLTYLEFRGIITGKR